MQIRAILLLVVMFLSPFVFAEDTKPEISLSEVRIQAKQASLETIEAIEESYGRTATYLSDFQRGFFRAFNDLRWNFDSKPSHLLTYQQSFQEGESQGRIDGLSAGQGQAMRIGSERGRKNAKERFETAIELGVLPSDKVTAPPSGFSGLRAHIPEPWSLGRRFLRKKIEINSEIQKRVKGNDWEFGWDIGHLLRDRPQDKDLKFNWQGRWAFRKWLSQDLNLKSGVVHIEWYRSLDAYSNGRDAQTEFESAFINSYDSQIELAVERLKKKGDLEAQDFGYRFANQTLSEYATELGYFDSYYDSYLKSSIEGYENVFSREFLKGFSETFNFYANNSVPENLKVRLVDSSGNRHFAPGTLVSVIVTQLSNFGGQDFSEPLRVKGPSLVNSYVSSSEMSLPGLSRLTAPAKFLDIGPLKEDLILDKTYPILVELGDEVQKVEFKVTFSDIVKQALVYQVSEEEEQILIDRIIKELSDEWNELSTGLFTGNAYKGGNEVTYLELLNEEFKSADPVFQARIQDRINEFKAIIGARPTNWFYFLYRARWDAANKLIDEMGN